MNRRLEWVLFILGCALLAALHGVLYFHSGALWRDELHSVVIARSPNWLKMFHSLAVDSFPGLWVSVLRLWIDAGMGAADWWTRLLGPVISVAMVAALWLNTRWTRTSPPVLALAFAAFNPAIFYFGSSLRAYGLAVILVVLLFGAVWRVAEEPRASWTAAAVLLAILCANANYQDSYLIFAICSAGAVVCLTRGQWRRAVLILAIGLAGALSLLPYVPVIREYAEGGSIRQAPIHPADIWTQFSEAFDAARILGRPSQGFLRFGGTLLPALLLLFAALLVLTIYLARRKRADPVFRAALYGALVIAIAGAALYRFVLFSGLPTFPWHFIPFIGLAAVALDFALDRFVSGKKPLRRARLAAMAAVLLGCAIPLWDLAHLRRTNIDLAAADVADVAAQRDFVLVSPFWYCYPFKYYYKGPAPWSILPVVPDDQIDLEYNAIKPLMTKRDPLQPAFARIEQTLKNGGRLWIVGRMPGPAPGVLPPTVAPAPDPVHGWDNVWYMQVWAMQTNYFVKKHATRFIVVSEERGRPVSSLERAEIAMAEGWKD